MLQSATDTGVEAFIAKREDRRDESGKGSLSGAEVCSSKRFSLVRERSHSGPSTLTLASA